MRAHARAWCAPRMRAHFKNFEKQMRATSFLLKISFAGFVRQIRSLKSWTVVGTHMFSHTCMNVWNRFWRVHGRGHSGRKRLVLAWVFTCEAQFPALILMYKKMFEQSQPDNDGSQCVYSSESDQLWNHRDDGAIMELCLWNPIYLSPRFQSYPETSNSRALVGSITSRIACYR